VTLVHRCGRTIRRPGLDQVPTVHARRSPCGGLPGRAPATPMNQTFASVRLMLNAAQEMALVLGDSSASWAARKLSRP
jgi:hypothetical protein